MVGCRQGKLQVAAAAGGLLQSPTHRRISITKFHIFAIGSSREAIKMCSFGQTTKKGLLMTSPPDKGKCRARVRLLQMIRRLSKLEVAIYREELICPTARMSAEIARNVRHTMKCFTNFSIEKLLRNTETTVKTSIDMNDNFQETQPKSHIRMRKRCSFSALQVHFLEVEFAKNRYISSEQRQWLSIFLGLTPQQVKIWFQNRRYKTKLAEPKYQHTLAWCYSTTNTNKETDCTNAYD